MCVAIHDTIIERRICTSERSPGNNLTPFWLPEMLQTQGPSAESYFSATCGPKAGAGPRIRPATDHDDDDALTQARGGVPPPPVELLPRGAERGEWREEHMLCECWVREHQVQTQVWGADGGDSEGVGGGCRWEVREGGSPSCVRSQLGHILQCTRSRRPEYKSLRQDILSPLPHTHLPSLPPPPLSLRRPPSSPLP